MAVRGKASEFTKAIHDKLLSQRPFEDRQNLEDAARRLITGPTGGPVRDDSGRVVWDASTSACG